MEQLLLHLFGDFIVQNDHVALNKKKNTLKGWLYCTWHCITYALPFIFITNWYGVLLIALTHFVIDKTNIVAYFLAFRNNVKDYGIITDWRGTRQHVKYDISNFGFLKERPFAITIWLLIFTDNTIHLIGNYLIILYLK